MKVIMHVRVLYSNGDKMQPLVHSFHSVLFTHIHFWLTHFCLQSLNAAQICMHVYQKYVCLYTEHSLACVQKSEQPIVWIYAE